jgi:hypothetical protein
MLRALPVKLVNSDGRQKALNSSAAPARGWRKGAGAEDEKKAHTIEREGGTATARDAVSG